LSLIAATAWLLFRPPTLDQNPPTEQTFEGSRTPGLSLSTGEPTPAEQPVQQALERSPATPTTLAIPQKGVGTGIVERNLVGQNPKRASLARGSVH